MTDKKPETELTATGKGHDLSAWLRGDLTLTLPRWALVAVGLAAFILLLVALD
ncbi:hypothetical protein LSUCC0031_13655 [Rhodobacterales bacterium LSUCC0031]|nr:hypothetical protein [Rhodobacterales bacterium LSUCC0031]